MFVLETVKLSQMIWVNNPSGGFTLQRATLSLMTFSQRGITSTNSHTSSHQTDEVLLALINPMHNQAMDSLIILLVRFDSTDGVDRKYAYLTNQHADDVSLVLVTRGGAVTVGTEFEV
ncbi:hypothetical protein Tco_1353708 [Tanacetum coccineum]